MVTVTTVTFTDQEEWNEVLTARGGYPPLTTFFEPPAGCSTQWIHNSNEPGVIWSGTGGFDDGLPTNYFARCNPYSQTTPQYSPGVCTSGQDLVDITEAFFSSSVLWLGICCDRGMTLRSGVVCEKTFTSPLEAYTSFTFTVSSPWSLCDSGNSTVVAVDLTTGICSGDPSGSRAQVIEVTTIRQPPTEILSGTASAGLMSVFWQSSDLTNFPVEYASSLASVIGVPFTAATPPNTTTPSNTTSPEPARPSSDANNKGSSLNPGAIAGIAVGIGAFVICSIVSLLYLWRRRKRRQRPQHPDVSEMEGSSAGLKRFMGGKWRAETDGTSEPVEAGSTSVRIIPGPPVELDGTQRERDQ